MIRYGVLLASLLGLTFGSVTLDLSQYVNANHYRVVVFSGTISSHAGGEYVEVLARDCGARSERLVAGTRTTGAGAWKVEDQTVSFVSLYSGTTFRARWNGEYSAARLWQLAAVPRVARVSGTRTWVAHAQPATPTGQVSLQGKPPAGAERGAVLPPGSV